MTIRERIETALRGGMPDAVPFNAYENMLPRCQAERQLRNDGMGIVRRRSVLQTETPHVTTETRTYPRDGRTLVTKTYHTPCGDLTETRTPADFTSWWVDRIFKSEKDYEAVECLIRDRVHAPRYEPYVRVEEELGHDGICRAGVAYSPLQEIIYVIMGIEAFAQEWAARRDHVMALYDALTEDRRKMYPIVAASPALHANYGGNCSPEILGLERFESMVAPHYDEFAEAMHAQGKLAGTHLDANNKLWAHVVARSKLDYIEAFTPDPDTDMSVADAREAWPGKALWINFPSSVHLRAAQQIEAVTRQILRQAAPGDAFLISITEDVPPDRWQESFRTILRTCNTAGRTPIGASPGPPRS